MAAEKREIDWDKMEPLWRAGLVPKKTLAAQFGVSRPAIEKHWAKLGIERDLTAKIRQEADALVARQAVAQEVAQTVAQRLHVTEKTIVEANAQIQADVRVAHRTDIGRFRALSIKLLAEHEAMADNGPLFAQLGEILASQDEKAIDRLNDIYRKVIDLPQRTKGLKELSETLKTLIALEREAYCIDKEEEALSDSIADAIRKARGE